VTYTLTATTASGCMGQDKINIKVYKGPDIYVPAAFTPNGDGHNDILRAVPAGIQNFQYFAVYSRWGKRIFYTINASAGWDGKIDGLPQSDDTYIWMAQGIDYRGSIIKRQGTVVILR